MGLGYVGDGRPEPLWCEERDASLPLELRSEHVAQILTCLESFFVRAFFVRDFFVRAAQQMVRI